VVLGKELVAITGVPGTSSAIGITIFGHTMTVWQDVLVVLAFGAVLLSLAVFFFSRQE